MDTQPRFERERIARQGFRKGNTKLVALAQVEEHQAIQYGTPRVLV